MFMGRSWSVAHRGTEQKLFLYKHVDTRHYLNLSPDGTCFRFTATGYVPIALDQAIEHVFGYSHKGIRAHIVTMRDEKETYVMSKSINKVFLLGNVGKDPEIKSTAGGTLVANLSLATSERFKDRSGEVQERTEWHNLVAYARGAEIIRDYVKKGSKLHVEGRLNTRSWDDKDSGKKVYRTEIVVVDVSLLSGSDGTNGNHAKSTSKTAGSAGHTEAEDYGEVGITDDDIPF
jgi:single-strand DNA-binding protein